MNKNIEELQNHVPERLKSRRVLAGIIAALLLLLIIVCVATCNRPDYSNAGGPSLGVPEALDSLESMLPKGSKLVARYPDEQRHCLYYINSGVLYYFDAKTKNLEEITVDGFPSGSIVSTKLSQDEQFITLALNAGKMNHLYRINTMNRNLVDLEKTEEAKIEEPEEEVKEKKPVKVKKDTVKVEKTEEKKPEPKHEEVLQDVMMEEVPAN